MKSLRILRMKPNPRRKEQFVTTGGKPSPAHLGGEWVDIMNMSRRPVELDGVELCRLERAVTPRGTGSMWKRVVKLAGVLEGEEVLRVHSGLGPEATVLHTEDQSGAHYHLFMGTNEYLWSISETEYLALHDSISGEWIDRVSYDANPPQDVPLLRVEGKLAPM